MINVKPCTSDIGGSSFSADPHIETRVFWGWASDDFLDDSCRRSLSQIPKPIPLQSTHSVVNAVEDEIWVYALAPVTTMIGLAGDMDGQYWEY
jgi:hypothetical protein